MATEKWLTKYGLGKALVLSRFVPFIRTMINPLAGVVHVPARKFFIWNLIGGVIWTEVVIGAGYILGEKLKGSVDHYILPIVAVIVLLSISPIIWEVYKGFKKKGKK